MDLGLSGKTAFVSAATSGMGLAVARGLAAEGVNVALLGRRGALAEAEAGRIRDDFRVQALGLEADILDSASLESAMAQAAETLGRVDILVLNGPGPRPGGSASIQAEEVVQAAETMIRPHVQMVQEFLEGMTARHWGRILAVGSFTMDRASTDLSLSAIGRAGFQRYLQALAREVAPNGITVNIVQPGLIATSRIEALDQAQSEQTGESPQEVRRRREASIPFGRLGHPDEFASAAVFLASEPARYITGQSLLVDGGLYSAG